jgi:DNA-binding NarL/FixJ family response regulator
MSTRVLGVLAIAATLTLDPPLIWTALVVIMIGAVLAAELLNTALEHALDAAHPEPSPLVKIAKDCSAAAVLVLSSYPEEEFAVRSFKLGAAGYLTKASVSDEMLAAVKKVLAGGRYMSATLAEKLATALGSPPEQAPHEALSPRELEVLRLVATGKTIKEIAALLSLSEKTIATYRTRVSEKLGLSTNVELARYALQHRLVE